MTSNYKESTSSNSKLSEREPHHEGTFWTKRNSTYKISGNDDKEESKMKRKTDGAHKTPKRETHKQIDLHKRKKQKISQQLSISMSHYVEQFPERFTSTTTDSGEARSILKRPTLSTLRTTLIV